ncbi:MAG: hypothetical protein A2Z15_05090 [Chloroflexi bacterium RBG_16_50_11]|nr:MAG: hypothetical protein A2Z15_05090 [Chloroflexi bacterium RBG_16_50_11]
MNDINGPDRFLTELGDKRLREMDKAGITMQVLSLTAPGVEAFSSADGITWAKRINDDLSTTVMKYPERFAGFASLPLQEPEAAADELQRAVKKLGLKGALVNSHVRGEYLDNPKFWVVFEKAEKLGVPIYIHPKEPSPDMLKPYLAYPGLWSALWGYGAEAGLHAIRLICSGLFDKYPNLKIIIGHMGEALPFWTWRLDRQWQHTPMAKILSKKPSQYIKENFLITTSGVFSVPALLCAYLTLGAENILFAVDFPYESNETAVQFIKDAPINDSEKEKIFHLNAEKVLGLKG